jgi:transketolase
MISEAEFKERARNVRLSVLRMIKRAKAAHIGAAFSIVELLVGLYFSALRIDPKKPSGPSRDRFILSKGHSCAALYAALAERGFADGKVLEGFCADNGTLWGHSTAGTMPGIEASTGSLGHGLPIGVGMALAGKMDKAPYRVFVLLGDGEMDEGSVWEALLFAGHRKLDNLVAVVDYNKVQSFGMTAEVLGLEPLAAKFKAANWSAREIDGHSAKEIMGALAAVPLEKGRPTAIIAHTIKGKGVSFMEGTVDWHYKCPDDEQYKRAEREIMEGAGVPARAGKGGREISEGKAHA